MYKYKVQSYVSVGFHIIHVSRIFDILICVYTYILIYICVLLITEYSSNHIQTDTLLPTVLNDFSLFYILLWICGTHDFFTNVHTICTISTM